MTSMMGANEILKQDVLGRVQVPVERREALLAEFERSGLSGVKFARMAGIKYQTFITWVRKGRGQVQVAAPRERARGARALEEAEGSGKAVRLFEALVERDKGGGAGSGGLVVELPGGSRMEVVSPVQAQMAAELVVLIAQRSGARC